MSLQAVLASPMRNRRCPPHRPRAADAPTRADHLKALRLRVKFDLTEEETARALGVSRVTIGRWVKKALEYPEAKQILSGPLD